MSQRSGERMRTTRGNSKEERLPRLLVSIFEKVLIGNVAVVLLGAVVGTLVTREFFRIQEAALAFGFSFGGVLLSAAVNYTLLRIAFRPLYQLRDTISKITQGDRQARAIESSDDPLIHDLSASFNQMVDALETSRREASRMIIETQEQERKRVARELHDETTQDLASLAIRTELLRSKLHDPLLVQAVAELQEEIERTLTEMRRITYDLRPSMLDDLGLAAAIHWYVQHRVDSEQVQVDLQVDELPRYDSSLETAVFRIIQEAVSNAVKYAQMHHLEIHVHEQPSGKQLQVLISDDGVGFDPSSVRTEASGRGLGLYGMRERAETIGAHLEIQSSPGNGTKILLVVPIPQEQWEERSDADARLVSG